MDEKYKEMRKTLLGYIYHLMKLSKISIEDLAVKIDFKTGTLERMLEGKFNPTLEQFLIILDALEFQIIIKPKTHE